MMQGSSVTATLILALVAVVIAPSSAMPETLDSVLTAKAKIALFADEQVKGRLITVETVKGLVILRGKIDSSESKVRASSVVEALPGVKRVRNDLQVTSSETGRRSPPPTRTSRAGYRLVSRRSPRSARSVCARAAERWPSPGSWRRSTSVLALPRSPVAYPAFAPSRTSSPMTPRRARPSNPERPAPFRRARSSEGASTAPSEPPPEMDCAGEADARTAVPPRAWSVREECGRRASALLARGRRLMSVALMSVWSDGPADRREQDALVERLAQVRGRAACCTRSRVAASSCAVMKMTGMAARSAASRSWRSNPVMPFRWMSRTRHAVRPTAPRRETPGGRERLDDVARGLQQPPERPADGRIVVDDGDQGHGELDIRALEEL